MYYILEIVIVFITYSNFLHRSKSYIWLLRCSVVSQPMFFLSFSQRPLYLHVQGKTQDEVNSK